MLPIAALTHSDWLFELVSVCQAFVGRVLEADREQFAEALAWFAMALPAPRDLLEREISHAQLRDCAHRAAALFHHFHHYRWERQEGCGWRETGWDGMLWARRGEDPRHVLAEWTGLFLSSFDDTHARPLAPRVAALIRSAVPGPLDIDALSRQVAASGSAIARAFKAEHGATLKEYHRQATLRWAARELRQPNAKVEAIAALAGYSSRSGFYSAFEAHSKLRPAEVRSLSDNQFGPWLDGTFRLPTARS